MSAHRIGDLLGDGRYRTVSQNARRLDVAEVSPNAGGHLATVWIVLVAKEVPLWRHYEAVGYWSSSRHQESANHFS